MTTHGNGACRQDQDSLAQSLWCHHTTSNTWCLRMPRAASRVGRSSMSGDWDAKCGSTPAMQQRFLGSHLSGPLMGLGECADVLLGQHKCH